MAAPLDNFVKQLTDSGIISPGKLENFIPPKATPKDAQELARQLIQSKHLTQFQAQEIYAGRAKALILGNYTILARIGAGGMGQVFKAEHRRMKRVVAIKMLPKSVTKDAAAAARFQREVEAAAKLRHPNIVAADDADEANGVHFLVMEYVEGSDLSVLIKKNGPLPVVKAVNYILQAAKGLEFAHGKGVIHRDIKPANLLLGNDGVVKILDMGLARIESSGDAATQAELTGTGAVMGTVDYMAPEQALSTKHADAKADVYSLGCTLYYLLSGKCTYDGDTLMAKLLAHREQTIPSLRDVQGDVPERLQAVFSTMVAKKAEDRYQTMTEVVRAIEALRLGGLSSSGVEEEANTWQLSNEQKLKLTKSGGSQTAKPLGSIAKVATEKSKHLVGKIIGGAFATIIAPILVTFLIKYLEKKDQPEKPPGAAVPTANSSLPSPLAGEGPGVRGPAPADIPSTAEPSSSARPWNTPAFQQWMQSVAAIPAEKQIEAVSKKLMELNPGFDGKLSGHGEGSPRIENGVVTVLRLDTDNVIDVSPVRVLVGLKGLELAGSGKSSGMGKLSDLSSLRGMQLTSLLCATTQVADLSPLKGMPLTLLRCLHVPVSDLSPLRGMPLAELNCNATNVSDLSPLSDCKDLKILNVSNTKVTAAGVAALQKALPNCKIEWNGTATANALSPQPSPFKGEGAKAYKDPAFQQWMKNVAAMPADKQIEAVSKKLMELNPGFDGKFTAAGSADPLRVQNGMVKSLGFHVDEVTDISPVRAFAGLEYLACNRSKYLTGKARLIDLSPLQGMPLTRLELVDTQVLDLSPLKGTRLTLIVCTRTQVSDLSPLKGMPLTRIDILGTKVSDLSPLAGMPLDVVNCNATQVNDLTPLAGMKLRQLSCSSTPVSDLSPLKACQSLTDLDVKSTKVTAAGVAALQKALPNCKIVWDDPGKATQNAIADADRRGADLWLSKVKGTGKGFLHVNGKQIDTVADLPHEPFRVTGWGQDAMTDQDLQLVCGLAGVTDVISNGCKATEAGLAELKRLPKLRLLSLNSGTITDDSLKLIGQLDTLSSLGLYGTPISDAGLKHIGGLKNLKLLHVKLTKVTAGGVATLQNSLPDCKIEWDDPAKPMTPAPASAGSK